MSLSGRWRPRLVATIAALAATAMTGACGVTRDKGVRPIQQVPFGLAEPTTTSTSLAPPSTVPPTVATTAPATSTTVPTELISLYYASGDRIRQERRPVPVPATGARLDPAATLRQLETGPTTPGLQNLLTPDLIGAVPVGGGRAQVAVTPAFQALSAPLQLAVVAQLVLTLTDRPGIGRVTFVDLTGQPVPVPRADGSVADDVAFEDYRALLA